MAWEENPRICLHMQLIAILSRTEVELQNGIADKQLALTKEIAALTKQRDELLPLLMNGQATVNYHLSDD